MDNENSYQRNCALSLRRGVDEVDGLGTAGKLLKQHSVEGGSENMATCWNGSGPSTNAPMVSYVRSDHPGCQEPERFSSSGPYLQGPHPQNLYMPQQSGAVIPIAVEPLSTSGQTPELDVEPEPSDKRQFARCTPSSNPQPDEKPLASVADQASFAGKLAQSYQYRDFSGAEECNAQNLPLMTGLATFTSSSLNPITNNPRLEGHHPAIHSGNFQASLQATYGGSSDSPLLESGRGTVFPHAPGLVQDFYCSGIFAYSCGMKLADAPASPFETMLRVPLLTHQKQDVIWMAEMESRDCKGGILEDDTGLGKTLQALALIVSRPSPSPKRRATLVVMSANLIRQWEREIKQVLRPTHKQSRVYTLYGNKRRVGFQDLDRHDIVLTSFGTVASELRRKQRMSPNAAAELQCLPILGPASQWHRVILDETQSTLSDRSKAAIVCRNIDASYRWCLTGSRS